MYECRNGVFPVGRTGAVPLRHADDVQQSGVGGGRPHEGHTGAADLQPRPRSVGGRGDHRGDSVLLGHNGHGGGLCKRRAHEPERRGGRHHGRQHRHHHHRTAGGLGYRGAGPAVGLPGRRPLSFHQGAPGPEHLWHCGRAGHFVCGHEYDVRRAYPPCRTTRPL